MCASSPTGKLGPAKRTRWRVSAHNAVSLRGACCDIVRGRRRWLGPPDNRGVNFRALARLFSGIEERTDEVFTLEISMLEIYNECVYDLLVEPPRRATDRQKLDIRKVSGGPPLHPATQRALW